MLYAVGDQVQVIPGLGGWTGFVTDVTGGPGPQGVAYHVERRYGEDRELQGLLVQEQEIAAGPLPITLTVQIGDPVSLAGDPGEVVDDWGNDRYLVKMESRAVPKDVIHDRVHLVPLWRLALEN